MFGHEIHRLGRDELPGGDEVAFIFPVGVVHDDHHSAPLQIRDDRFDRMERLCHSDS